MFLFLKLCGPVKSWKRAQDPTDGSPKGFGFCEFEAAEGILRALRLLTKLNIDGQDLVVSYLSSKFRFNYIYDIEHSSIYMHIEGRREGG